MHGHDGAGPVGDGGLDLAGVDLERLGVGVDEDGQGAHRRRTAFTVATNVYGGTMTSSPGPTPSATSEVMSEEVPLAMATQCLAPVSSA